MNIKHRGTETSAQQSLGSKTSDTSCDGWRPVSVNALPTFLADNEYLLHGHRPQLKSVVECMKSAFSVHTETVNIWTHFIGSLGAFLLCVYYLVTVAIDWPQRLVFALFFMGAVFCMGASATYHTFLCYSETTAIVLAKFDYCGIVMLITTSFAPWLHFGFYGNPFIKTAYMLLVMLLGSLCVAVVVQDKFRQPRYRKLRAGIFIGLGLTGVVPGIHYMVAEGLYECFYHFFWLVLMAVIYIVGGVTYACRVPERLFPGRFDIYCHSHQILHICVIGGVLACYHGASTLALAKQNSLLNDIPNTV